MMLIVLMLLLAEDFVIISLCDGIVFSAWFFTGSRLPVCHEAPTMAQINTSAMGWRFVS
jgi:hypothetical protein